MNNRIPLAAAVVIALLLGNPLRAATPNELTITDVTVIPMDKDDEHQVVTIRDGVIVSIAPVASASSRVGTVIDGHGKFLLPRLVDAHAHIKPLRASLANGGTRFGRLTSELQPSHPYDSRVLFNYLREGVTTVFHLGGGGTDVLELRDLIQRSSILGPRLVVGKLIEGPPEAVVEDLRKTPPPSSVDDPQTAADGRAAVVADRYDFIKSYQHLNQQTYDAIEAAAYAAHLITMGHLPEICCMPAGAYRALGLLAYDAKRGQWAIWWLDERYPASPPDPPFKGRFENGVGRLYADYTQDGKSMRARFVFSDITPTSARWEQAFSSDAGKTWDTNWIVDVSRER